MPYSSSDYDTAVSAFNVLPETLAVENLINLRQRNEIGGLSINKMKRDEQTELDDASQLAGFSSFMSQNSDLGEEDWSKAASSHLRANPGMAQNKDVMDILKNTSEAYGQINKSKANAAMGRSLDFNAEHEKDVQDRQWLNEQNEYSKAILEKKRTDAALESGSVMDDAKTGEFLSGLNMKPEVQGSFSRVMTNLKSAGLESFIPGIGQIAASLSYGSLVDGSQSHNLSKHKPILSELANNGIVIDPDLPDDEYAKRLTAAQAKVAGDPNRLSMLSKAAEAQAVYRKNKAVTGTNTANVEEMLKKIEALGDKAIAGGLNPADLNELRKTLGETAIHAGKIKGLYDENMRQRGVEIDNTKDDLDLENKRQTILKKINDTKDANEDNRLARMKFEMEQARAEGMPEDKAARLLTSLYDDLKGTPEQRFQKARELMEENSKYYSTRGARTPGTVGGSIPRK